jgi:hypothetical protein
VAGVFRLFWSSSGILILILILVLVLVLIPAGFCTSSLPSLVSEIPSGGGSIRERFFEQEPVPLAVTQLSSGPCRYSFVEHGVLP